MRIGEIQKRQSGFTYLTLLFTIAVAGIVLAKAGIDWSQDAQREKEKELLFVGDQYRQAIALYYQRTPGAVKRYPAKLEDLLTDARYSTPQHYMRQLYRDPVTNRKQWGTIMAPEGGIMGVYSLSDKKPIKTSNFGYADQSFEGTTKYSDWQFIYTFPILPQMQIIK